MPIKTLIIDDDRTFLKLFEASLTKWKRPQDGLLLADTGARAYPLIDRGGIDVIITDLVLPDTYGIEVLRYAKSRNSATEVIVITGQGSIDSAVEAMRLGARDYLTKPLNTGILTEKLDNIREFIERGREAEDYRFAKEAIESDASRTVTEMEIKLNGYMTAVRNIRNILGDAGAAGDEKISMIETVMSKLQD